MCIFWANVTPFSLQPVESVVGLTAAPWMDGSMKKKVGGELGDHVEVITSPGQYSHSDKTLYIS